ncbi:heme oxygenase (biliverdin-producing) [Homoserinibacter sp. GY 40078]|uniref:biliverdin-producing heme oxygenase n=1 Tax=Homoserinibacter sp. GY 40078 TaxID=2603275 RepID=UPI0011CC5341|nr:biliverdin-producing heme oxygenase [Homoserinibacter sp. GY 40078]TXK18959.1 biliverdin-producing heme oxygenase [Homoserinibacter sp. GY 40078]
MSVIPFSQALRERTWSSHSDSEGAGFMTDLMKGEGTRDDYIALVAQHYFIYAALEAAETVFAGDAVVEHFATPRLTRLPALEADLEFLLGDDWREQITPLPTTVAYVDRIRHVAAERWAGGFVAHHYTRYLGDLSGGQFIRKVMQRHFGFETNGVGFYLFDEIASPQEFKETYRDELDRVAWDDAERERVIDEVLLAYRFNTELFEDLARAKTAA